MSGGWPRDLRRRLAEIVGSNPTGGMGVCCECCVLSGRGLCDELIIRPEESYRQWCVVVCDLETSRMRRPWPTLGRSATWGKKCLVENNTIKWWLIIIYNYKYFETSAMLTSHETFNSAHLRPQVDRFAEHNSKVIPGKEPRAAWLLSRHRRCWWRKQKRDLGFSQRYCRRISYSGTWRCVYW